MEIIIGKTAGFCYGVKRAIEGAKKEISKKQNIYCLGEIVHNNIVIKSLEEKGLKIIDSIEKSKGNTIIRAHGVKKEVYEYAKNNNIKLKDYTCKNVLKIHDIVEEHAKNNYFIFLCGNKDHPENIGTTSFCGKNYYNIENIEDIKKAIESFKITKLKKALLISQTTYSFSSFQEIEETLKNNIDNNIELIIKNTICKATEIRQKETEKIVKKVDYMIIIGGKKSSNTRKLYEIAKKHSENCICIESKEELDIKQVKGYKKIGIMAGASTPQESIDEMVEQIRK